MKLRLIIILSIFTLIVSSCFKEDDPVPPYVPPEDVISVSLQNSIYNYQIYFDFSSGEITGQNKITDWVLGFECGSEKYRIRINSSYFWGVAPTATTDFASLFPGKTSYIWKSDKSDGNPDSTAVGNWVNFDSGTPVYSNEVYLLGRDDGDSYTAIKKVQFIYVDELSYKFIIAGIDESVGDTVTVLKNDDFSTVQYSISENKTMELEPKKGEWDILFTPYYTILYTDGGIRTPYFVRGVLLNPYNVASSLDTIVEFRNIDYSIANSNVFSTAQDAIGHDWKDYMLGEGSESAEYKVRKGYSYLIKDTDNELYKLRFTSFFSSEGKKGYPSFEYTLLIPE